MNANELGRKAIGFYTRHVLQMKVEKLAALPTGPKILAANHPTTTDPFYLLAIPDEPLTILITEMAFKAPLFGGYLRAAGHIPVVEGQGRAAFDAAVATLRAGRSIGIFPEGALSPRDGGIGPGRTGAVRLALEAGVPIVPVGIYLNRRRIHYVPTTCGDLSAEARWYPGGPYAMTVGEALYLDGDGEDRDYVKHETARLLERIRLLATMSHWQLASATTSLSDSLITA